MGRTHLIFILKNLIRMGLLLAAVSIATFALVAASPIDPLQANVGQAALGTMSEEQQEKLRSYWGVDTPPAERYLNWARDAIRGDMGTSLLYRQPVTEVIGVKLANSLFLMGMAWVISGVLGFVLGMIAGVCRGRLPDKNHQGVFAADCQHAGFLAGSPSADRLRRLAENSAYRPERAYRCGDLRRYVSGSGPSCHFAALTLSITGVSNIALHTRRNDRCDGSDYVLFSRARGESLKSIVWHHGIRNVLLPAMDPAVRLYQRDYRRLRSGGTGFFLSGLGQAAVAAGTGSDVPLLMGITLITAAIVFLGNFIANRSTARLIPEFAEEEGRMKTAGKGKNMRQRARFLLIIAVIFLAGVAAAGVLCRDAAMVTDFSRKDLAPCLKYPFARTGWERNMFYRTLTGLSMSILIGVCAAGVSAAMALVLGVAAATLGKKTDSVISFFIDMVMGIPTFCCWY